MKESITNYVLDLLMTLQSTVKLYTTRINDELKIFTFQKNRSVYFLVVHAIKPKTRVALAEIDLEMNVKMLNNFS